MFKECFKLSALAEQEAPAEKAERVVLVEMAVAVALAAKVAMAYSITLQRTAEVVGLAVMVAPGGPVELVESVVMAATVATFPFK
jgi:hypothetical protein